MFVTVKDSLSPLLAIRFSFLPSVRSAISYGAISALAESPSHSILLSPSVCSQGVMVLDEYKARLCRIAFFGYAPQGTLGARRKNSFAVRFLPRSPPRSLASRLPPGFAFSLQLCSKKGFFTCSPNAIAAVIDKAGSE